MMLTYTANMQADPLEKAQFGLSYLDFMNQKGAKFFTQNPSAVKILERLKKLDMRYIAHEFFNQHWNPLYFTEVAEEMRGASLGFAGNAEVSRNYGELTIPAGFLEDFKEITDRYSFEAHRSFVNNESFRSDIYCKPMKVSGDTNFMRNFAFIGLVTMENYNSTLKTEAATLELNGKLFQPLIQVLYARVMTLDQLCKQPALNAFSEQEISDGLQKLVMTGQVIPLKPVQEASASEQPYGREMASLLNGHLLGQYRLTNPVLALSSPVMGRAWKFSLGDALMLFGLTRKDQRQAIAAIRGKLRMEEKILNTKDGKQIAKQEEEKFSQQELQVFIDNQLPLLQRLGFFKGEE